MIIALPQGTPKTEDAGYIAPNATIAGNVTLGKNVSVWFNAVIRSESKNDPIVIGQETNVQDSVTIHFNYGHPVTVGKRVTIGHNAVLHGCRVEDDCLIGMNATVLDDAVIGQGSLVAAGAVVPEGMIVPKNSMVAGVPAKVKKVYTDGETATHDNYYLYLKESDLYKNESYLVNTDASGAV